ncbi:MAG: hypothetical protein V3R16_02395 [Nitrospirales bacterium]
MDTDAVGFIENKGWKSPSEMLASYRATENIRGMPADRLVELPKDLDNAEEMGKFYTKLGRPEGADKYTLPESDMGQGGVDLAPKFREWAFAAGLNQRQVTSIFEAYQAELQGIVERQETDRSQHQQLAETQMRMEWGQEFEANIAAAKRFAHIFGLPEEWLQAAENTMATEEDPSGKKALLRGAAKIGRAISEHRFVGETDRIGDAFGTTPASAKTQITDLLADRSFLEPYQNKQHPGHQAAMDKMTRLHQLAYPETRT